ncbi:DMT family transporter [Anaplasmataceae bacterium AB001_6]|nr:DMT family transporter [Anaplasmataceae bacterium AB001_6]
MRFGLNTGAIIMLIHICTGCILNYNYRYLSEYFSREYLQNIINISTVLYIIPLYIILYITKRGTKTKILHWHLIRAACYVISQIILCYVFSVIPFTQIVSITLTYPIFAAIAGIIFLNEEANIKQLIALLLGFIGTIIIVQPFSNAFQAESMWVFIAIALWIVFDIITRKIKNTNETCENQFLYIMLCYISISFFVYLYIMLGNNNEDIQKFDNIFEGIKNFYILGLIMIIYLYTALGCIYYANSLISVIPVYMFSFVLGTVIGCYFFHETLKISIICGTTLILISNVMCILDKKNEKFNKKT